MIDYYEMLELSPKASPEVVRSVYKVLMQHYELSGQSNALEKTKKINELNQAYTILSNPEKRRAYDIELAKTRNEIYQFFQDNKINDVTSNNASTSSGCQCVHNSAFTESMGEDLNGTSLLSRLKWKRWGWGISIVVVIVILISMVRPDPEKALRGQMAVKLEAEKDRKALEAELKKTEADVQTTRPSEIDAKNEKEAKAVEIKNVDVDPKP